jgi:hypothetical protein
LLVLPFTAGKADPPQPGHHPEIQHKSGWRSDPSGGSSYGECFESCLEQCSIHFANNPEGWDGCSLGCVYGCSYCD